jgi:Putative auto-transporter adhesin, head GIN domain
MTKPGSTIIVLALLFTQFAIQAQTHTKNYPFNNFEQVWIESINGQVEIKTGTAYSITIEGEDGAAEQVEVSALEKQLTLKLATKFSKDWKNRKTVRISITMPQLTTLHNASNADITVNGINEKFCKIDNNGNGDVSITGSAIDLLEIENKGNGDVNAKDVTAATVQIRMAGNGDVSIQTNNNFTVDMAGNGDAVNYGQGHAIIKNQTGNGKVLYRK